MITKITWSIAPKLTVAVKAAKEGQVKLDSRKANNDSEDTVFIIKKPSGLTIEYTVKIAKSNGSRYVNWGRVYGKDEEVQAFLDEAGYQPVVSTNEQHPEL